MRRRDILIAAATAPAVLSLSRGSAAARDRRPNVAVFDGRHDESRLWAERLGRSGVTVFDARWDVARLWYGPLRRLRDAGRRPVIAGLTTWADFQVLSGCAAEARLHVHHELLRRSGPDGRRCGTLVSWRLT